MLESLLYEIENCKSRLRSKIKVDFSLEGSSRFKKEASKILINPDHALQEIWDLIEETFPKAESPCFELTPERKVELINACWNQYLKAVIDHVFYEYMHAVLTELATKQWKKSHSYGKAKSRC